MTNTGGAIHFEITASNDELKQKLEESRQAIIDSTKVAEKEVSKIEIKFNPETLAKSFLDIQKTLVAISDKIPPLKIPVEDPNKEFTELLNEFGSYEQQRTDITKQYTAKRAKMYAEDGKTLKEGATQGNVDMLNRKEKSDLKGVDTKEIEVLKASMPLFASFADKSKKELREIANNAQNVLEYINNTPTAQIEDKFGMSAEKLQALKNDTTTVTAAYDKIIEAEKKLTPKTSIIELGSNLNKYHKSLQSIGDAKSTLKETKKDPNATDEDIKNAESSVRRAKIASEDIKVNLSSAATKVGKEMSQVGTSLQAAGKSLGNETLADVGQAFSLIGDTVSKVASGDYLGAALGVFNAWAEAEGRHRKALQELDKSKLAQQRAYNLSVMEQNLLYKQGITMFGDDPYGKAKNSVKEYKNNSIELNKELEKLGSLQVVTGHKKTGLFNMGGGKDTYSSILSVYPKLIKDNGEFDADLAKTIISTQKMSDVTKASLQNVVDISEQQAKALEETKNYLTGIFGNLGGTVSNALADAFTNGTDAAKAFTDSVSDMLENLAKQMVYSVTIAPLMEKAQVDMLGIMEDITLSDEEKFKKQAGLMGKLTKDAIGQQKKANELYKIAQDAAAEEKIDIFKPEEAETKREATAKGIATASQESVDENNGRLTAIQGHTFELNENMKALLPNIDNITNSVGMIRDNAAEQLIALHAIRDNTAPLSEMKLEIGAMKTDINSIVLHGIKIR